MGYYKDDDRNGYQPKGSGKMGEPPCEEPMNENAEHDFAEAIKEVVEKVNKTLGEHLPIIDFEGIGETYSGVMRLKNSAPWRTIADALIYNGYAVSVTLEEATETEKALDGVEDYIVIAYDEVE